MAKDVGLRIRMEPELRQAFVFTCKAQDLSAAQVLRAYMRKYVDEQGVVLQPDLFESTMEKNA